MTNTTCRAIFPVAALALLLTACGGGDDEGIFVEDRDPSASGLSASVNVAAPASSALSGTYASNNIFLNNVTKVNPIGGEPETCRFRFSGLQQQVAGSTRAMNGDIRYLPGPDQVRNAWVAISSIEFGLSGVNGAAATVDRANNRIVFTNAQFTSTQNTGQTIAVNGSIPMRGNRPGGC